MFRQVFVLGIVAALISALAMTAALQSTSSEVGAQEPPQVLDYLCLDPYTGIYMANYSGNCPTGRQLITLPDDYPITLCSSVYTPQFRAPLVNGDCQEPNGVRLDLPDDLPAVVCVSPYTGRISPSTPFPDGSCNTGFMATFPSPFVVNSDTYQTLGNVDIDVPASNGVLANDTGTGLEVTGFQTPSANGGIVNVNSDGSLTYTPPAPDPDAFTGNDTFTYDVEDDLGNSETVTVTIEVLTPAVWFVDADAEAPGDGRRNTPLDDIEVLNDTESDPDNAGDFIFLFEAENHYLADFFLEQSQYLVGQNVDLAEVLESAIGGSTLLGFSADSLPPFLVTPAVDPTTGAEVVLESAGGPALSMDDNSTATGHWVFGGTALGVRAEAAVDTALIQVFVVGGTDGDGQSAIFLLESSMTVTNSQIAGGSGTESGDGGSDAIYISDSELTVDDSLVTGGVGLPGITGASGSGGNGIFIEFAGHVTVTGGATVIGGEGGSGGSFGGDGGAGIQGGFGFSPLPVISGEPERDLQGEPVPPGDAPSITVSGASLVQGGAGGDGDFGGYGGDGINAFPFIVSVSESSTVRGGNGASGEDEGGFGGTAIAIGQDDFGPLSSPSSGSELMGAVPEEVTILSVDSSTLEGGDGGSGDFAGFGGEGIATLIPFDIISSPSSSSLQGAIGESLTLVIDVTSSTVSGGDGGEGGVYGGYGGTGIVQSSSFFLPFGASPSLQGIEPSFDVSIELNVTSSTVAGGVGGGGSEAGYGGAGIIDGFPPFFIDSLNSNDTDREDRQSELLGLFEPGSIVNHLSVVDSTVTGGPGADGADVGGDGGPGIVSFGGGFFDIAAGSTLQGNGSLILGSATVSNSTATGGDGGNSPTGLYAGWGGDGIAVLGTNLVVDQGTEATGGQGGNGDEGDGGWGIYAEYANAIVDDATITGGNGGDGPVAGLGGEAIGVLEASLTVSNQSQATGGDSGAATSEAVPGGDGILADFSSVEITDSTITAGTGSAGTGTDGERGGHGVHVSGCIFCNTLDVTNTTITGGDGGDSNLTGGDGGEGVLIENDNATISGSTVTGGNGGNGGSGDGPGGPGVYFEQEDGVARWLILDSNTLTGGLGDQGQMDSLYVEFDDEATGSVCVDARGNTPTGDFTLENETATDDLGITQTSTAAMSADNNGVTVNENGTISTSCTVPTP